MPITWNDFDKIWAVSSPLTPYTFSDLNYAAGWDFIGSTPPARQMWDSLQKANDEKFKFLRDNFGTPNMVTTAAQMTDTDKIYVYVGSEAGWNNGHWYYYDAGTSAWVDGGVYNSTAFVTDTTLTEAGKAADAKAVGDALALKADLAGATFTGNVAVNADFSTTGDATVASDLTVSGATTLTGNVTASGNVSVVGDIDADNITLTGDISATDVTASGDVTAGSLSVSGATTLTGNVTAGADITATGDVTANDASFANATLSGTLSVTGATTLDGLTAGSVSAQSLNTTGNVTVGGTLTVSGATTLADITTGDINANDITATGDISADDITANTLTVSGASTLTGNITAGADITVTGDLSVNDITASGDITADNVTANGNLSVVGNATLSGVSTAVTPAEDDNSTKIATTAYVQTEIKPIETDVTINDKRISNIEKLLQGNLYDYQTDTGSAYTKTVPNGAMPYASLDSIGGKTLVFNQMNNNSASTSTINDVIFTNNEDGSWTVNGTASANALKNVSLSNFPLIQGHKYLIKGCPLNGSNSTYYLELVNVANDMGDGQIFVWNNANNNSILRIRIINGYTATNLKFYPQYVDLTLCYGAGNEPSTVAEFQQQFPAQYYPYNAGTLLSADVTSVVSVGRNILDTQNLTEVSIGYSSASTPRSLAEHQVWKGIGYSGGTFNSKITSYSVGNGTVTYNSSANGYGIGFSLKVKPSTTYRFHCTKGTASGMFFLQYGADGLPASNSYNNQNVDSVAITTTANTVWLIVGVAPLSGAVDTNVTVSNLMVEESATDTAYTPYTENTYPIPAEVQALEGYGWSAGSVYNYIDYERKVFVKCVDRADLGSLLWAYASGAGAFYTPSLSNIVKPATINNICSRYVMGTIHNYDAQIASQPDKKVYRETNNNIIFIKDSDYGTDASTFKSSLNGVYLIYELQTPIETDISEYITDDNLIEVEAGGTLTFPNSNGTDYQIHVPSAETYMVDLQSALGE